MARKTKKTGSIKGTAKTGKPGKSARRNTHGKKANHRPENIRKKTGKSALFPDTKKLFPDDDPELLEMANKERIKDFHSDNEEDGGLHVPDEELDDLIMPDDPAGDDEDSGEDDF